MNGKINLTSRREFLRLLLAGLLASSTAGTFAESTNNSPIPRRFLGQTGIETSMLGFGTGTMAVAGISEQSQLGSSLLISLLEFAWHQGIRFFDIAEDFGTLPMVAEALDTNGGAIPRNESILISKINMTAWVQNPTHFKSQTAYVQQQIDSQLLALGTDYLDLLLLQRMGFEEASGNWIENFKPAMEALSQAKSDGKVRAIGVSVVSSEGNLNALRLAVESPWPEVIMTRLNVWGGPGHFMDGDRDEVASLLWQAKLSGKGIIGTKILNAGFNYSPGNLTSEGKELALNFARLSILDAFPIGFTGQDQITGIISILQNLSAADFSRKFWKIF